MYRIFNKNSLFGNLLESNIYVLYFSERKRGGSGQCGPHNERRRVWRVQVSAVYVTLLCIYTSRHFPFVVIIIMFNLTEPVSGLESD